MYGNMSSIEKALNKNDLQAYKNYDTGQYSLVPGMQHAKMAPRNFESPKKNLEAKFAEKQQILKQMNRPLEGMRQSLDV